MKPVDTGILPVDMANRKDVELLRLERLPQDLQIEDGGWRMRPFWVSGSLWPHSSALKL